MLLAGSVIRVIAFLLYIVRLLLNLYSLLIVIDALLSWIPILAYSKLGQWIGRLVDPYLNLFRRGPFARLAQATGIDFSPILALLVLYFIEDIVVNQWLVNIITRLVS